MEASTSGRGQQALADWGGRWLTERARRWLSLVLQAGPLPEHIAFVMDGNRRYADRQHWARIAGHRLGYCKVPTYQYTGCSSTPGLHACI